MSAFNRSSVPRSVALVRWGVFILAAVNFWQAGAIDRQAQFLLVRDPSFDPRLRALLAVVWALWFASLGVGVWQKRPWTRVTIPASLLGYTLYQLGLLAVARSPVARGGWPAGAVAGLLATGVGYWALNRPAAKLYFHRSATET